MRLALAMSALAALSGCAKILGLDQTTFDQMDAPTDSPSVCDGAPACTSTTGRSICGQLYTTGAEAGTPLRVESPTGMTCTSVATTGPCAFTVGAAALATYFSGGALTAGTIDDCGRYVVPDVEPSATNVAVAFEAASGFKKNASIVFNRTAVPGVDQNIDAYVVSDETVTAWGMQISTSSPPDMSTGYLVRYTAAGVPLAGEQVAKDSSSPLMNPPGTAPWAAYFTDAAPLGVIDPAQTMTSSNGTAYANLGANTFSLEGFRVGRRCTRPGLQQVANTLIFVIEVDC